MFSRHGTFVDCKGSLEKYKISSVCPGLSWIPRRVLNYLSLESIILAEHVHNAELYLVSAGKFKGTFDLFIVNPHLYLYMLNDLNI